MDALSDEELALLAGKGNAKAFEMLLTRHADRIFKISWKWLGNRADAEDITQDICMKLANKIHYYQATSKFTTWLYQVTLNEVRDHYRKEKRRVGYETAFYERVDVANDPSASAEYAQVLHMLHKLPTEQKEAVILVMCQGLSHKEAGKILGCAENTVAWRIFEARKKLKLWYEHG